MIAFSFFQKEEKLPKHLTQSIALEESSLPHVVRFGVALVGGLLGLFIVWAALTYVEEVATGHGQVIPSGHVQTIQHLEGGIVKAILVQDGDLVEKGQPLLKLDDKSTDADLGQIKAREAALEKNLMLTKKENTIKQNLAAKGYGSELMALTSERELTQIQGQLAEVQKIREKLEGANDRTVITSPVRGIVKGLNINTIGAVVESGKLLMEIVPMEGQMLVEVMMSPSDVGHLQQGQKVKVKVSAYEFSRYGTVPGILKYISATTFQNQEGHTFYKVRILLKKTYVGQDPSRNLIMPGMTVQADIITNDRSVLRYLLKPIHIAIETAFHEH